LSRAARLLVERGIVAACGASLLVWAPLAGLQPRVGALLAACGGIGAGVALFVTLARRAPQRFRPHAVAIRALVLTAPALLAAAVGEEAIWRYLLLGVLRGLAGTSGALAASTAAFAFAHGLGGVRAVRIHVVTGACFGTVYIASGRLVAAVAAHLAYNLLVVAARAGPLDAAQPLGAT
jgi:membrane protease YdiL (CAAX protease family)